MSPAGVLRPRKSRFLGCAAAFVLASPLSGCYLARAAWEEARILAAREPIEKLVGGRSLSAASRAKLSLVLEARRFASEAVGLTPGHSFTTYSDIGRDTLVLVLSAAYRDTLASYVWSYPVVGRLPYRGYFDFGAGRREAARMESEGFDTYLRTSDAFSTLGWLDDPLLSTTLRHDSLELVNTVIHELTHNTFFAKGQGVFNESFASFTGARGAEAFFRAHGDTVAAARADARWRDEKLLSAFWAKVSRSLDSAFAANASRASRLLARDSVYATARQELIENVGRQLRTISPRYAEWVPLNNAYLLAHRVYGERLALFDDVYVCEHRQLRASVARILALAKGGKDPFEAVSRWVADSCLEAVRAR